MDCISNIKKNECIRESLIELKSIATRKQIREDKELKEKLVELLSHEDPKVRKNCAIILGEYQDTIDLLLNAYHREDTEYVKEAYLKGMSIQDCHDYFSDLKTIQKGLLEQNNVASKHIQAQLKILNPLILKSQTHKKKVIKLKHDYVDVVLTTLPYYQFVLFESVLHLKYKQVSQGVLVRTNSILDLQTIRTYKDMLLPLRGASSMNIDIDSFAAGFERCNLLEILSKLYDDHSVFYFKVIDEMREKNSQLVKKVSEKLFQIYPQTLLNSTENHDIEIVLKEVKQGKVNAYLKLSHLNNPRFIYRKEATATSMHPYVAATLVALAKPYMISNAKVLDPFVGSSTLLIERNIVKPAHFALGLDVYGQGIESARKNAKLAGQSNYYVHKDALRFVNNELFDEIFTDMPTFAQMKDQSQLQDLYDRFFSRIHKLVKHEGYVFIYTSEISLVRKNLRLQEGYLSLEEHFEIPRGKNMFYFFIIKVK